MYVRVVGNLLVGGVLMDPRARGIARTGHELVYLAATDKQGKRVDRECHLCWKNKNTWYYYCIRCRDRHFAEGLDVHEAILCCMCVTRRTIVGGGPIISFRVEVEAAAGIVLLQGRRPYS